MTDKHYDELLNLRTSTRFDGRQKAALAHTDAIVWNGSRPWICAITTCQRMGSRAGQPPASVKKFTEPQPSRNARS